MKTNILKMMVVAGTLISSQAFAVVDFNGRWVANSGKVSSTMSGLGGDCTKVEIYIKQTETQLITETYNADCGLWSKKFSNKVLELRDGKVFEQHGENLDEVGTISDTTLMTLTTSGVYQYAYNLKKTFDEVNGYTVQSYWGTKGSAGAIVVEALHKRVD